MKYMAKKIISLILSFLIIFSVSAVYASDNITVEVDGSEINFDVPPQIINERTMVPMRAIFERLGATVEWDAGTQSIHAVKGSDTVNMQIGSADMLVNDAIKVLDSVPVIIDGRTLVPARAIAEAFNCRVEWYDWSSTVAIFTARDTSFFPSFEEFSGIALAEYDEEFRSSYYESGSDKVDEYADLLVSDYGFVKEVSDEYGHQIRLENWKAKLSYSILTDSYDDSVYIAENDSFFLISYDKLPSYEEITGEVAKEIDDLGIHVYDLNSDAIAQYTQYLKNEYNFDVITEQPYPEELVIKINALGMPVVWIYCEEEFGEAWLMY